jgi:hypothetical protein
LASILEDISIERIISIPSVVFVLVISEEERGRAKAIIKQTKDNPRRIYNIGLSRVRHVETDLTPCKEEKSTEGISFFRPIHSHPTRRGKSRKSQKNSGFTKVISFISILWKTSVFSRFKVTIFFGSFQEKNHFFSLLYPLKKATLVG